MRLITASMFALLVASGQQIDNQERKLNCNNADRSENDDQVRHCEIKEFSLPGVRVLTVDSGSNGGVQVKGWTRSDVLVRAQLQVWAPAGMDPRGMTSQIQ